MSSLPLSFLPSIAPIELRRCDVHRDRLDAAPRGEIGAGSPPFRKDGMPNSGKTNPNRKPVWIPRPQRPRVQQNPLHKDLPSNPPPGRSLLTAAATRRTHTSIRSLYHVRPLDATRFPSNPRRVCDYVVCGSGGSLKAE